MVFFLDDGGAVHSDAGVVEVVVVLVSAKEQDAAPTVAVGSFGHVELCDFESYCLLDVVPCTLGNESKEVLWEETAVCVEGVVETIEESPWIEVGEWLLNGFAHAAVDDELAAGVEPEIGAGALDHAAAFVEGAGGAEVVVEGGIGSGGVCDVFFE